MVKFKKIMSRITLDDPLYSIDNDGIELIIRFDHAEFYRTVFSFFKRRNSGVWRYKYALSDVGIYQSFVFTNFKGMGYGA